MASGSLGTAATASCKAACCESKSMSCIRQKQTYRSQQQIKVPSSVDQEFSDTARVIMFGTAANLDSSSAGNNHHESAQHFANNSITGHTLLL